MDEFKFLREKEEETSGKIGAEDAESGFQLVYGKKKSGSMREYEKDEGFPASSSLLGVKVATKDNKTATAWSKVPFHIPTIPRPQVEYNILVNNKNQPFEHVWLEKSGDGSRFIHPLEKLSVVDFVDRNVAEGEPVKPLSLEETPFKLVEQEKDLKKLASKLKGVTEFAVDLEHNQYRSFQGLTCLMQISTRTEDFVIDTLKLRIHVGPYLREVFEDPLKRKVMHGADRDILWLQRDFGIYVCNLFDTGQASRVLQLERNNLEYLLNHFCEVKANKEYQNAEWRLRPLLGEMLKYAREDTHYLLYIYDLMKIRLRSMSTNGTDLLLEVHKRSNEICLQLYEKELLTDTSYLHIYGLQEAEFNSQQLAVVAGLCHWRDTVAREEDESTGYILPNEAILEIARQMPLSSGKLYQMVKSKHPFVERYLSSVIGIIRSSIAGCSAFESIAEQLKNRRQETSALQSVEAVGCKKELLPSTEDPMESTVSLEDSLGGATITTIAQSAESAPAHITSVNDCATPANSLQLTTEISSDSGIQQKLETISVSATGESSTISDGIGVMDKEKTGNGSLQPVRKEKKASVQILKKPTTCNNSNVMEPSDGSTSCPSSAYYSATQSPCSDFVVDDPPIFAAVQPTLSSPSFSLRHSVDQLHCALNLDESDQDFDASCSPTWSWNSDADRLRSCDVYVGFNGWQPLLLRLVKWLRAELEMHGVSCFASDRSKCRNAFDHAVARTAINMASLGVVIITPMSFSNPYCIEEMHVFSERKRLIPIFLGLSKDDCIVRDIIERKGKLWERFGGELWTAYGGIERKWKDIICALLDIQFKLQVNAGNLRDCIMDAVEFVGVRLGRRCIVKTVARWRELAADEFPYMRNDNFIGRRDELHELEYMLFGNVEGHKEEDKPIYTRTKGRDRNVATVPERNSIRPIRERSLQEHKERCISKKPMEWKESQDHQEMHGSKSNKNDPLYSNGMACVSGESGFGKTELLLEFAYRFSQRYKMVLWVGGETRYLRGNYIKLLPQLDVDVGLQNELYLEENSLRSFADMEEEVIYRVRRELMRDVPFLLIIDNLESEKDWWDGRSIRKLLPPLGVATHVLISTRLSRVMNIKSLRLLYMSGADAMSLMKGSSTNLKTEDIVALRLIEEKLGRLPLGLALVGSIISEFHIDPTKLLDSINKVSCNELTWNAKEVMLKHNPFLLQLLELCFSMLDHAKSRNKLAAKMLEASSWFAPSPIPISMLVLAARGSSKEQYQKLFWKKCRRVVSCTCMLSNVERPEVESLSMLIRLGIGRASVKSEFITFHDIIKEYARKRGNNKISRSVVQAISSEGSVPQHSDHIWAACFLLFKFGTDPVVVKLSTRDMLSFIKHLVVPLVSWSYTVFSKYSDVLELLQLSTEALEALEDSFIDEANVAQQKSSCLSFKSQSTVEFGLLLYQDLVHLRAILLETRARLMLRGGQYDTAQQLCQTAVSIKEVIYGREHPETQSTHGTFERVMRYRSKF